MNRGPLPPTHPALLEAMKDPEIAFGVGKLALDLYEYCAPWVEYDEQLGDFEVRYWQGDHHATPEAATVSANGGPDG